MKSTSVSGSVKRANGRNKIKNFGAKQKFVKTLKVKGFSQISSDTQRRRTYKDKIPIEYISWQIQLDKKRKR